MTSSKTDSGSPSRSETRLDKDYPQRLKFAEDGPIVLYAKGKMDLNVPRVVSIVGTRKPTDYGKELMMTESEFMDLVRKNIKAQLVDVIFLTTLLALYFGMKANAPEDDEDEAVKNQYKFMLRAADKVTDELLYFYNPTSITSLVSSGIFPSMSYLTNFSKLLKNFMVENYAISIGDKELEEKNQVIKYPKIEAIITNRLIAFNFSILLIF